MSGLTEFKQRFRAAAAPTVFACLLMYTGYHLVYGGHGILAYVEAQEDLQAVQASHARILAERVALEARVQRLRPEGIDPDLLDERARVLLGRVHPNDYVVRSF